ncbi:MAG: hypothetical protein K2K87_13025 [Lachnospiraceae bacterium]|nr:hypothetical protein [Lachnospiraceae bacterium]
MSIYLDKIRTPEKGISLKRQLMATIGVIVFGFALGVLQKWIDGSPSNIFPLLMQRLDIRNYFGRLAVWILLATVISIYSKTPLRASINTFSFFVSMLAGYYLYCNYILGFLPKAYMMVWVGISFASIFMAYICWYAKGNGMISILISGAIIGVLFAQAFSLTQGFYVYHIMEIITWMIGVVILRRKPKEVVIELGFSFMIAAVYQLAIPYWG